MPNHQCVSQHLRIGSAQYSDARANIIASLIQGEADNFC